MDDSDKKLKMISNNITINGDMKDKALAFIAGDISVTLFQIFVGGIWGDLGHFGVKVGATIILGIAGGIAGMIGKDIYNRYKKYKNKK